MFTYTEVSKNKAYSVLLILVFLIFIIGLGWFASQYFGNPGILYAAVGFSTISALVSYYFSDQITLSISGAHEIDLKSHPELYQIVENLTISAGLPMPRV